MKIAHLILLHKNPVQIERLIKAMDHPAFDFYLHIDKKADVTPFLHLVNNKNVFLVRERASIYWAGYGTIQATINGFRDILPKNYAYINVISGQDFPIKPAEYIYQYLISRLGQEFITCESVEDEWPEAKVRVTAYHLINWQIPGRHKLEKLVNAILPARKFPLDYAIVGRANWFTLTHAASKYLLEFLDSHPEVTRFFKYSWGADELIFSTIIYNSPFKEKIRNNLVYVDWSGQTHGHPRILGVEDYDRLVQSDKLFARKMDMEKNALLFDKLEALIK
jgi:hypothetical protein